MANVKSHSKYVIRKKHQTINNGTIFERDFSTVGGIPQFPSTQKSYYHNGNFIVTVNTSQVTPKHYSKEDWEKNGDNITWTLNDIQSINKPIPNANKILLKQDYYNLRDFAYYGSCAELIRASISDIIKRFPGELYSPTIQNDEGITVYKSNGIDFLHENDGDGLRYLVDNPFNLDIHTPIDKLSEEQKKDIKYIQANLDKYEIFYKNHKFIITSVENTYYDTCGIDKRFQRVYFKLTRSDGNTHNLFIDCYRGDGGSVIYLTRKDNLNTSIRPLNTFYETFISSLDTFQSLLLKRDSMPLYSPIFEVLEETDYGYNSLYKRFTFPLGYGNYNLGINTSAYSGYINELFKYANYYDEYFCNNLNRQMIHESIKNFDYSRKYDEKQEEYEFGGDKLQKLLNVFGRELDEIKFYIDGIKDCNQITYNESNNLPDYFLTDTLNIEGWDVKNVLPSDSNTLTTPYKTNSKPYFYGYFENNCILSKKDSTSPIIVDKQDILREKIQEYTSEKEYNVLDINHRFFKNLKLSSRGILNKKGTVQSIEEILSLFGLKSKEWVEKYHNSRLNIEEDYKIEEFIIDIKNGLIDEYSEAKGMFEYDWYNSHKTIAYDSDEYRRGEYVEYQGLPIRYIQNDEKTRTLYPYFSSKMIIDGNPYYQMYGGWLKNGKLYNDTITQVSIVNNIFDLMSTPVNQLYNGVIFFVKNVKENFILIDDVIYDVYTKNNEHYIQVKVENKLLFIGRTPFVDKIIVNNTEININNKKNGEFINISVSLSDGVMNINENEENINIPYTYFQSHKNNTNYFKLNNIENKRLFGVNGWQRINKTDDEYQKVINLKRYYNGNNPHKGNFIYDDGKEYLRYFQQIFKYALENNSFDTTITKNDVETINTIGFNVLTKIDDCNESINLEPSNKIISFINSNKEPDTIINVKNIKITFMKRNDKYVKYIEDIVLHYLSQVIPNNTILEIAYE